MNSIKRLLAFFTLAAMLAAFAGCQRVSDGNKALFKSDAVEVALIDEPSEVHYVEASFRKLSEEEAFSENTIAVKGRVSNVRQAEAKYDYEGSEKTAQITLFDMEVENVLMCRSNAFPDKKVITVGMAYNDSFFASGSPRVYEGRDYLMFCIVSSEIEDDPMCKADYTDCWVGSRRSLIFERVGEYYLTYDVFSKIDGALSLHDDVGITENDWSVLTNSVSRKEEKLDRFFSQSVNGNAELDDDERKDVLESLDILNDRVETSAAVAECANSAYIIDSDLLEAHISSQGK